MDEFDPNKDPDEILDDDADTDIDDDILLKGKKPKGIADDLLGPDEESLDDLAEEEDELLPEDKYDDEYDI